MSVQYIIIALLSLLLLSACSSAKKIPLYKSDCYGQSLEFYVKEKKHFAYTEYWMEIKIGKLKTIIIRPQNVTDNSPYDFSLLNAHQHYLYDTISNTVQPENITKRKMMLFVNPSNYSKAEFEKINTCLSVHYKAMENALYEKYISPQYSFYHPQFAGIVYANPEEFINLYQSKEINQSVIVHFSGEVVYKDAKGEKIPAEFDAVQFVEVRENAPKHSSKYNEDAEWKHFTNTKTGSTLATDYEFYITQENLVYGVRK